jgi:hypothetical protein
MGIPGPEGPGPIRSTDMVKMITIAELAAAWGVSRQRVWQLRERIPGGQCAGGTAWVFPESTKDPAVRDAITETRYRKKSEKSENE